MGLDVTLIKKDSEFTEFDSQTDPTHLFKVGYFRSSYNEGGFNHIMRNLGLPTLYEVCLGSENSPEDYEVIPGWAAMKERAESVRAQVGSHPRAGWMVANAIYSTDPTQGKERAPRDVLLLAEEKLGDCTQEERFWTGGGLFSNPPMPVVAIVGGNRGDVFAVIDDPEQRKWLMDALSIVAETADYVLSQPAEEQPLYSLGWSA